MSAPYCGKQVKISGLSSKPELNGTTGVAASYDSARGRYNVQLPSGQTLALQPKNLEEVRGADGGGRSRVRKAR